MRHLLLLVVLLPGCGRISMHLPPEVRARGLVQERLAGATAIALAPAGPGRWGFEARVGGTHAAAGTIDLPARVVRLTRYGPLLDALAPFAGPALAPQHPPMAPVLDP